MSYYQRLSNLRCLYKNDVLCVTIDNKIQLLEDKGFITFYKIKNNK